MKLGCRISPPESRDASKTPVPGKCATNRKEQDDAGTCRVPQKFGALGLSGLRPHIWQLSKEGDIRQSRQTRSDLAQSGKELSHPDMH